MIFTAKMADLYGTTQPPSSNPEDISKYLQTLLHHNAPSASSSSSNPLKTQLVRSFSTSSPPENMAAVGVISDLRDGVNFSDPGVYFHGEAKESVGNAFYSVGVVDSDSNTSSKRKGISSENDLGEFSCESEKGPEASEAPSNPAPPRSSSKRTRAAEVHNLSEKRRRSRINEKMKALQSLIPNSNKTDKASMLDEAIEYLKQLQLQVQMLTMRNGLSLHPMCLPGVLQPVQFPSTGMGLDEANGNGLLHSNRATEPAHDTNQQTPMQTMYNLSNHGVSLSQPPSIVSPGNITSSGTAYGFELPMPVSLEHFNASTTSKEIRREETLPQLQMDSNECSRNPPSDAT